MLLTPELTAAAIGIVEEYPEYTLDQINSELCRSSIVVKDARSNFAQWLMQQGMQHELIFIDEAGINVWAKRTRGRAHVGECSVHIVGATRGQNLTMTFAVSATNGLLHHDLQEGGMNGQRFNLFLEHLAGQLPPDEMPRVLIFDNAPGRRWAQEAHLPGNFTLRWLPAYSLFLNCNEVSIKAWKLDIWKHKN